MRHAKPLALFLLVSGAVGPGLCSSSDTMQQQTSGSAAAPAYASGDIGADDLKADNRRDQYFYRD